METGITQSILAKLKVKKEFDAFIYLQSLRVAAKLDFQTVTPVEVGQRNDDQLLNPSFCCRCG